jgi:N-methylhydantoinase A
MVAGGAAAGAHAVSMAREIGIRKVIIPKMAGVLSAFGILAGDVSLNFARSLAVSTDAFDHKAVGGAVLSLKQEGIDFLNDMGVAPDRQILMFSCQARYRGQVWELTLPFEARDVESTDAASTLAKQFHNLHRALYQTASENDVVEITEWNLHATGKLADITLPDIRSEYKPAPPIGRRLAYFRELRKSAETPVYAPLSLTVDEPVRGPILIDEHLTTIVVGPGATVRLSRFGNYVVDID